MNLIRKKRNRQRILPLILIMTLLMLFSGCQKKPSASQQPVQGPTAEVSAATEQASVTEDTKAEATEQASAAEATKEEVAEQTSTATELASTDTAAREEPIDKITPDHTTTEAQATSITDASIADSTLPEDGTYTTKDDVALYIHTYGELPQNFITKKAAKKLGWQGGSLEDYAPGKCIGGDYFGNYEGLLPEDKEYHECDIDTLGKSKRGAKRIIYSDDGYIYYTDDHYKSFQLLYEP